MKCHDRKLRLFLLPSRVCFCIPSCVCRCTQNGLPGCHRKGHQAGSPPRWNNSPTILSFIYTIKLQSCFILISLSLSPYLLGSALYDVLSRDITGMDPFDQIQGIFSSIRRALGSGPSVTPEDAAAGGQRFRGANQSSRLDPSCISTQREHRAFLCYTQPGTLPNWQYDNNNNNNKSRSSIFTVVTSLLRPGQKTLGWSSHMSTRQWH